MDGSAEENVSVDGLYWSQAEHGQSLPLVPPLFPPWSQISAPPVTLWAIFWLPYQCLCFPFLTIPVPSHIKSNKQTRETDINKLVLVHMNINVDTLQNKAERLKQTSWWNHSQQGLFTGTIHMKGEVWVLQINSDWYTCIINTGRVGKLEFNSIKIDIRCCQVMLYRIIMCTHFTLIKALILLVEGLYNGKWFVAMDAITTLVEILDDTQADSLSGIFSFMLNCLWLLSDEKVI